MPTVTAPWSSRMPSLTRSTMPPSCSPGERKSCSTRPSARASRSPICAGRYQKWTKFIEFGRSQERPSGGAQGSFPRQEGEAADQEGIGQDQKADARLDQEADGRRRETRHQEAATLRQET